MGTPYNGPVLKEPPTQRQPYTGQVLTRKPGYLPAGSRDDSEVVVNPPSLPESVLNLVKGLASMPERAFKGEMGNGKPVMLPLKAGPDGFGFGPSEATDALARGITAPRRAATGQMTFEQMKREAPETAAVAITGGLATPRVLIPAGAKTMNAIGPPVRATANAVSTVAKAVAEPLTNKFGDMDTGIGKALLRRAMQDNPGLSPQDAIAQVEALYQRMGDTSVLADTGKSAQKLARNLAQGPGETGQLAEKNLGARSASQGSRLVASVKQNISPKNFHEELDAIELRQKETAGPLYKEAFDANKDIWSRDIGRILETDAGREAFETARSRMSNRMKKLGVPDAELTAQMKELVEAGKMDPVKGGVSKGFKLEFLDLIKQDLGEQEQRLKRAVISGTAKKGQMVEVGDLRRDLTAELDKLDATAKAGPNSMKAEGGAYARARRVYSDEASLQDAMEQGRGFVKGDQEVTEKLFKDLTDSQKEAFRIGVAREMAGMISNTGTLPAALRNVLQDNSIKARLKFLTPNEQSFNKLIGDIEREVGFQKTSNAVRGGSPTGSILMEEGQIAQDALRTAKEGAGAVMDLGQGRFASAGMRMVDFAMTQLSRMQMPEEMRNRIGRLLVSPDPADKEQAIRLMRAVAPQSMPKPPPNLRSP